MKKPDNVHEYDGYFTGIKRNPNPITKEEEDRLIAIAVERTKKRKAEQEAREALENEAKNTVSISVAAAPNVSILKTSR